MAGPGADTGSEAGKRNGGGSPPGDGGGGGGGDDDDSGAANLPPGLSRWHWEARGRMLDVPFSDLFVTEFRVQVMHPSNLSLIHSSIIY